MLSPTFTDSLTRARALAWRRRAATAVAGALLAASLAGAPAVGLTPIAAAVASEEVPFYTVKAPSQNGGEPEFLFAIAQRYLADGNRFAEIFELNEGRVQSDGLALTDPTVLNPGWVLQLPADASGDGLEFGPPLSEVPATAPQPRPVGPVPRSSREPDEEPRPSASAPTAVQSPPAPTAPAERSDDLPVTAAAPLGVVPFLIGGAAVVLLLAAAAVVLLRWRRRRRISGGGHALPTDRSSLWVIDSALKIVVAASEREGIAFPGLYIVTVDDDAVHLTLTAPTATAPTGWTASASGRTWTASLAHLQSQPVPATEAHPFPRLVSVGVSGTGRLLVDFSRAGGPISVDGDTAAVADVTDAWVSELTDSPWSPREQQVIRAGGREEGAVRGLDAMLGRLEQEGSGVLVIENAPSRAQSEMLGRLADSPDFSWVVLVKGAYGAARWRFTARDGVLKSGLLPDVRYSAPPARTPASAGS